MNELALHDSMLSVYSSLMAKKNPRFAGAVALYEKQGLSIGDLALMYGNTRQSMHDVLKRRGCRFRPHLRFGTDNHFWRGSSDDDWSQRVIEKAIKGGRLVPAVCCEECGASYRFKDGRRAIQAHHGDYNKPLDVTWLCQKCHHEWHKNNRAIPREL